MLRDTKQLRPAPLPATSRGLLFSLLLGIGIFVAGLRGPATETLAAAPPDDKPAAANNKERAPIDLSYVPDDALAVVAVRPAELARREGVAPLLKLTRDGGAQDNLGLPLSAIEEIKMAVVSVTAAVPAAPSAPRASGPQYPTSPFRNLTLSVFRTKEAHNWRTAPYIATTGALEFVPGKEPPRPPEGKAQFAGYYYLPDDRTLVIAPDAKLLQDITVPGKAESKPAWAKTWQELSRGDVAVTIDTQKLRKIIDAERARADSGISLALATAAPLWEQSQRVFLGTNLDQGLGLKVIAECPTEYAAGKFEQTAQALLTLGGGLLAGLQEKVDQAVEKANSDRFEDWGKTIKPLIAAADDLLKHAHLERRGTTVTLQSQSKLVGLPATAAFFLPAAQQARQAARRQQSINNMKQIMLALINHHDARRKFPPAVSSKDGKPLLSWRVAILPYLEQQALYKEFHLDEPWDSEHNKPLAAKMPQVYRSPGSKLTDDRTVYLTPRGDTTAFPGQQAIGFRDIIDGTARTIALVEVDDEHGVVWTRPDDWNFDPEHPKAGLGGQFGGGFLAAYCDGSVRFIADNIDPEVLKALFTRAGGEPGPTP